jgi:methylenetetrahydrofolate dehydrogenase (NADP+)/methenyltetrahydrofolate cyclohydrolase
LRYIKQKEKWALYCGIEFELIHLKENINQDELKKIIEQLNKNKNVSGYIVQLPLPEHINTQEIIYLIDPKKDVD